MRGAGSGTFYVSVASILPSKVPACSLLCVCGSGCRSRLWWDMKSPESMGERRVLGSFIPAALGCGWSPWDPEGWLDLKLEGRGEKIRQLLTHFLNDIVVFWWFFISALMKYWSTDPNCYCLSIFGSLRFSFRVPNWGEAMRMLNQKRNGVEKIYCSRVNAIIYWKKNWKETKYLDYLHSKWRLSWLPIWFALNAEDNPTFFIHLQKTWLLGVLCRGMKRHYAFLHSLS